MIIDGGKVVRAEFMMRSRNRTLTCRMTTKEKRTYHTVTKGKEVVRVLFPKICHMTNEGTAKGKEAFKHQVTAKEREVFRVVFTRS